jgi:hypothetical protein
MGRRRRTTDRAAKPRLLVRIEGTLFDCCPSFVGEGDFALAEHHPTLRTDGEQIKRK